MEHSFRDIIFTGITRAVIAIVRVGKLLLQSSNSGLSKKSKKIKKSKKKVQKLSF